MAVVGSRIDVSVRSAARLNPLAGVTVAVSPQVFLTADMSGSPVSSVVSNGMGEVVCYALPGTYSFTASGAVAIPDQVVTDTLGGGVSVSDEGVLTALINGKLAKASNLSDVADAATARVNLGLGSAATQPATAFDAAGAAAAAQAAAIAAAAADATTKANNAQTVAEGYTDTSVAALVNSAPATLDTLKELADALGDDANYAATVTAALALKAPLASPALTGTPTAPTAEPGTATTQLATTAFVAAAASGLAALAPAPTGVDDRAALNAWLAALPANVTTAQLRAGTYIFSQGPNSGGLPAGLIIPRSNLLVTGAGQGATVLDFSSWASPGRAILVCGGALLNSADPLNTANWITAQTVYTLQAPVAKYALTVTLTTTDAANFTAGDLIFIRTGQLTDGTTREPDAELNRVLSVDTGTGIITLAYPTAKPYVQEYVDTVSGFTTASSPTGAGAAVAFGVSKATGAVLTDIGFRDMTVLGHPGNSATIWHAQQTWGLTVENCEIPQYDYSALAARYARHVRFRNNTSNRAFTVTTTPQTVGPSTGCTDWDISDNTWTGYIARWHAHEGTAAYRVRRNHVRQNATATASTLTSSIDIRARAYDHEWSDNDFLGQASVANTDILTVSSDCTDGGIIRRNRFRSPGTRYTVNAQGAGWRIEDNDFPTGFTYSVSGLNYFRRNSPKDLDLDAAYRVVKASDESRASTVTLATDGALFFTLPGTSRQWKVTGTLYVEGSTTGDLLMQFAKPPGASTVWLAIGGNLAATAANGSVNLTMHTSNASIGMVGAGTVLAIRFEATLTMGATAGTFGVQWAQNASDATPTIVHAGSWLEAVPMAVAP